MRVGPIALLLLAVSAGCIEDHKVRAVLVEESYALDPTAPASAYDQLNMSGCVPGAFDPETRTITLGARDEGMKPTFVMIRHANDRYAALASGSGGGWLDYPYFREHGGAGSWAWSAPFRNTTDVVHLSYNSRGVTLNDVPLKVDEAVPFAYDYEAAWGNVTFGVHHRIVATSLGRVPYEMNASCVT